MKVRNLIVRDDRMAVERFLESGAPLSGYLAGSERGGPMVQRLEELWATKFGRRYAIACNSATSGLLAACEAEGVEGSHVYVPALSMSATAAVPRYCDAHLRFLDVDKYGCARFQEIGNPTIITSVFGCPPSNEWLKAYTPIILDNAQGVCATFTDHQGEKQWVEKMAEITVTSLNVHKQLNCGEGGIITTDDADLADAMRHFINHGEHDTRDNQIGLNLRLPEINAVLAISQLSRIDHTIGNLERLSRILDDIMPSKFAPLGVRPGCYSGRYCYAFHAGEDADERDMRLHSLNQEGCPAIRMYQPLYKLPAFARFAQQCPVAECLADGVIVLELCAWRFEDDLRAVARALEIASKL